MKFIKLSFSYLKKNFLYMALFAIVPTVFVGCLLRPFALFEFLNMYPSMRVENFGTIFNSIFKFSFLNIFLTLLGLIVISIFVSVAFGQLENHMRSGKINIKNSLKMVNNNFLVVFANILALFLIWFLLKFIFSGLMILIHLIFCGLNTTPYAICEIFAIFFSALAFVVFVQISAIFLLNIPNMLLNGYPAKQAFSSSIKLLNFNNFQFLLAMVLPFVVIIPLSSVLANNISILASIIGTFILSVYIPALVMTAYFELSNTSRYDNRKYYNYNGN